MKLRTKLIGDAAIYTISNFAVAGVPFLLLPVLTRILSPEDYGLIAMFTMVVSFFVVAAGLNIHGAVMVRYFEPKKFSMPCYVSTTLCILIITTVLLALFVWIFSRKIQLITALPLKWLMLAVVVAALQFLVQTLLTLWQASKQPLKFGALRLNHALMDGLVSILLVVVMLYSWQGRLFGIALAWTVTALIALYWLRREHWLTRNLNMAYAKDALRYGIPLLPHAIGGLLLATADRFMVTNFLDVASTGIYLVAIQIGLILGIAADAFNKAFAPWLMEALHNADLAKKRKIVRNTYLYFIVIVFLALAGSVCAPQLLGIMVGPKYQSASPIIGYIMLGNAFTGMYYMVTNYIFFARRTELLSVLTISVGVITTLFNWQLIQINGITGAAQAFMIGLALLFFGAWGLSQICYRMPWFDLTAASAIKP
ncbi:O-antigen/teichoic acid export membrane protein [Vogesella indigofera]|uniref:O-antigen/teichoic acid export membrane protein n=1 Tax=Vogesella indigofera TaxID=45465 RepID=A0A495BCY2_VOGIN|nr:oligosaccharide flippase family protein [Vogesella indigofera]RKQ58707.1 O-antigen/teichoic acid export membrane protein [Vogesella indigofera]